MHREGTGVHRGRIRRIAGGIGALREISVHYGKNRFIIMGPWGIPRTRFGIDAL